jgi:hypothetical protein
MEPIRTTSIDLATAYFAITGKQPTPYHIPGEALAQFDIPHDSTTSQLFADFAAGTLTLNIRHYSQCRSILFRQIQAVRP